MKKILLSAYACEPNKGSEPAVGWNIAVGLAAYYEVWVITRTNNQDSINEYLDENPIDNLHFVFYDLPKQITWWKRKQHGIQLYYYLWQIFIFFTAYRLHKEIKFDLVQHVTFVNYYKPSLLAFLGIPFVWGPVGGGDSTPNNYLDSFSPEGKFYEKSRAIYRSFSEHDPLVLETAKRATIGLASTPETERRLNKMGCKNTIIYSQVGMSVDEISNLSTGLDHTTKPFRFVSIGRLLPLKGFIMGIEAFHQANIPNSEYWIIGDGPEKERLVTLSRSLGIENKVIFWGELPHSTALQKLKLCNILVHPSLHESGGWVIAEAVCAGVPPICMNIGGPSILVDEAIGYRLIPQSPQITIHEISTIMKSVTANSRLYFELVDNCLLQSKSRFLWDSKIISLKNFVIDPILTKASIG